jgi:4a-hydroxytetrahydrobiopterin dehydratase
MRRAMRRTLASASNEGQRSPTKEEEMANRPVRLSAAELDAALAALPEWSLREGKLAREYRFRDFVEAWGFMSAAALLVQQMDHHPEWSNVYGTVKVELVTHDAQGVTARDVELARRFEALAVRWPRA